MEKSKGFVLKIVLVSLLTLLIVFIMCVMHLSKKEEFTHRDYGEIEKEGVLRVVIDYNAIGYFVSGDTIAGFNYELLKLIQTFISPRIEILLESSLDKRLKGLTTGKYDVLASGIPITTEMLNDFRFTTPITQNRQVLVQRKKEYNNELAPLRSHLDLAKKTLHIAKGSPIILRIKNMSSEIGDTIYYIENELYNSEQLILEVAAGDIDFAVCDEHTAKRMASSLPEIDYFTQIGFTNLEAWAMRTDSPQLLDSLNSWITRAKTTQSYGVLYNKYYLHNKFGQ